MSKEQRETKAYLEFVHNKAKTLISKDIRRKQSLQQYTYFLKNLWKEVKSGTKSVEEVQRLARETLHEFFPEECSEDSIPTFVRYNANLMPYTYRAERRNEDEHRRGVKSHSMPPGSSLGIVSATGHIHKGRRISNVAESARQSRYRFNHQLVPRKQVMRISSATSLLPTNNSLRSTEMHVDGQSVDSEISSRSTDEGDVRKIRERDPQELSLEAECEGRKRAKENDEGEIGRKHDNVDDSQQGYLLDRTTSEDILKQITLKNRIEHYEDCVLPSLEMAVLIRLTALLSSFRDMKQLRKREIFSSNNYDESRSVVLVSMEREQEEAHLLRKMEERVSRRLLKAKNGDVAKGEVGKNQWDKSTSNYKPATIKPRKAILRARAERNNELLKRRRSIMSQLVNNRRTKLLRDKRKELRPGKEIKDSLDERENEKRSDKLTATEKLSQLPSLISRFQLEKQLEVARSTSTPMEERKKTSTITLVDCDRVIEFDQQLRKSNLRYKWMSRL